MPGAGVTLTGCMNQIYWLLILWRLLSGEVPSDWLFVLCLPFCNDVLDPDELMDGWVDCKAGYVLCQMSMCGHTFTAEHKAGTEVV